MSEQILVEVKCIDCGMKRKVQKKLILPKRCKDCSTDKQRDMGLGGF